MDNGASKQIGNSADTSRTPRIWRFLWRGAVGGAAGGFLCVALGVLPSFGFPLNWKALIFWLILVYVKLGLPEGVIIGALVGIMIWLVNRYRRISLGLIGRFLIGTLIGVMITWMTVWWLTEQGDYVPMPWHPQFLRIIFFGAALGGVAGIIARTKRPRKRDLGADHQFGPQLKGSEQERDST